jgi:formylmethanofuran dehydrogenase subunit D
MARRLILITGRSTKQGRTIHLGKAAQEYLDEVGALEMHPADMQAIGIKAGDQVKIASPHGEAVLKCREGSIPEGLAFAAYGGFVNALVGPDTQGTGMPDSKGIEIEVVRHE